MDKFGQITPLGEQLFAEPMICHTGMKHRCAISGWIGFDLQVG